MDFKADLHLHTTYSDGAYSPAELVGKAHGAGLQTIAVTDHDSVGAVEEAMRHASTFGMEVVPGVELSACTETAEFHILGYFVDVTNVEFLNALGDLRERRMRRVERIVGKLNRLNIPLTMDEVMGSSSGDSLGRPHIANAMVNQGHADSYYQAFNKFLGDGRPAFEKKDCFSPRETIRMIAAAGGLSFLAHPGVALNDDCVKHLIDEGLDGIEVVHPSHSPELVRYYRNIVSQYYLLECGGSDFHGGMKNDEHLLGKISIPLSTVDAMRRRLIS
ncbi:MAG TPA: PHP domain-containing protein [Bacteroidota bacterium]|nr:PHP domain-containing protein [Bacteroidota bacterium]